MLLFMRRMIIAGVAVLVFVVPFFAINMLSATGNVASADKRSHEERKSHEETSQNLVDRRNDAVARRKQAQAVASGETEESARGKIEQVKAEHFASWGSSQQCKDITLPLSQKVCADIRALEAKAAAAKAYEKAVAEIAEIDAATKKGEVAVQSTGEGAAANVVAVASWLGYSNISQAGAEKALEWGRGGMLELGAAIGPGVMNLFAWLLLGGASEAEARRIAAKERRRVEAEEAEARRRETEARFAAEIEAQAEAEAKEKAKAERVAKRAEAKTRETGDPETVKRWLNSNKTILSPEHVLSQPVAYGLQTSFESLA